MAYKKQPRAGTDVFGTFLSNVSSDTSSTDDVSGSTQASHSAADATASNPDPVSVAILLYLLENGPQPAGGLLSGVGMPLQDFFIAAQTMRSRELISSSQSAQGETFSLTEQGVNEAKHWKSMLGFMQGT